MGVLDCTGKTSDENKRTDDNMPCLDCECSSLKVALNTKPFENMSIVCLK
jgi:hypothetical protein